MPTPKRNEFMNQLQIQKITKALYAATQALSEKKDEINRLNVFPVPDGDTGTNMLLTMETVLSELSQLSAHPSLPEVLKAVTHGSLMGARGNSGVIISQILRGACEGLEEAKEMTAETIATAANRSVDVAFNAVRKPVEGTILTVLKDCAAVANQAAKDEQDALQALRLISAEALASVRRTPELLPVLKENGVVDAGGFGLAILIEGFSAYLSGEGPDIPATAVMTSSAYEVSIEQIDDWDPNSTYRYCTEFLFTANGLDEEASLNFLESMGNCELLVGSSPHYKVHVHTNEPGTILSYMTGRGQISEVFIHNMHLQGKERKKNLDEDHAQSLLADAPLSGDANKQSAGTEKNLPRAIGFIAVASGPGTTRILESQDVDFVVHGGQTMNPSTKDFVDAIDTVNAKAIIIFPNNKNIILAANAAVSNASKPAAVIPTTSVPQSFSALFVADQDASFEDNVAAMNEAIAEVKTAEITTAIKEAKAADGSPIVAGNIIGITEAGIEVVGSDVTEVAMQLLPLIAKDADMLTLLAGIDFSDEQLTVLSNRIETAWPELETDCQRGDQPLYPLIMAAE